MMKTTLILFAFALTLVFGCNSDHIRPFIPGTYTDEYSHEYGTSNDTLIIRATKGNHFTITKRTALNRIRNGKKGLREYKSETWQAVYDEQSKTLTETRKGKILTFFPEANKMMVDSREYKKQ